MRIHGKGKLNNQLLEKIKKGATAIEIHLEKELLEDIPLTEAFDLSYIDKAPIYVVHMPLTDEDVNIETEIGRKAIKRVAELCDIIAKHQRHKVLIVAHLATSVKKLKQLGLYQQTIKTVTDIVDSYDNIEIGIENITILHQDSNIFEFYGTSLYDNIEFVKDCNRQSIGTVIDTCHVLQNEAILNFLKPFIQKPYILNSKPYNYDIETYFKENKKYAKLIHLANCNYNGLMENHGTAFTKKEEDMNKLKQIMECYKKYEYNVPITIEVREINYNNSLNFKETLENLKIVMNELNIKY